MKDFQQQFKEFILNDIFWFNKSELNFGIYKIFRQKEEFIKEKLEAIVQNIEKELSSDQEEKFNELKNEILEYIPPKKAKDIVIENTEKLKELIEQYGNGDIDELMQKLKAITSEEKYDSTKVYEYLYQFFNLYYEKGDFGYTPRSFRIYSIPYVYEEYLNTPESKNTCEVSHSVDYKGEETLFTWKTKDSYYIKSNKFLNSVTLNLEYKNKNYTINTNIIEKDEDIKDDKKVKQYRLVSIKKEDNVITLSFNISDYATPKHTIYLAMLSVIEEGIEALDYNAIYADKKIREYFESVPFENKNIQTSLMDKNQQKLLSKFRELIEDETFVKYLFSKDKNIFKSELSGEEDKTQLKSKVSKLMIGKKDYVSKIYTKTTAKELLGLGKKAKFDLEDKVDYEKLYEKDGLLNFFYRLDRGINLFYAGVDSDYFIHKNLKRFLSVELDKFIKNYIFADTDAILRMNESAQRTATFARVFKNQANIFIELLSSIEEFQKYIWEKRKMVKSSNYIISSNKIEDANLLELVLKNRDQLDEWENLGITKPNIKPKIEELQKNSYPVDTKYFDDTFKYQVLSQFEDIEKEISGLLIKSENYQALKFLEPKYTDKKGDGKIKCVYIDPPYNTGNDGFVYKDNFKSASWLSMMNDRLEVAKRLMREDGVIFTSIDDKEINDLNILNKYFFDKTFNYIRKRNRKAARLNKFIANDMEYVIASIKKQDAIKGFIGSESTENTRPVINLQNSISQRVLKKGSEVRSLKEGVLKKGIYKVKSFEFKILDDIQIVNYKTLNNTTLEANFRVSQDYFDKKLVYITKNNGLRRHVLEDELKEKTPNAILDLNIAKNEDAEDYLKNLFNESIFTNPKPQELISYLISFQETNGEMSIILDFFGGSGTTADAVIKMNQKEDIQRKFILVEMNDYFDSIVLPRVKKVNFSSEWKDGKAQNKDGYSGIFQYIELEQYDDIIDNLEVIDNDDYSKVSFGYIYEPDKNQINFRMENELKNPLDENNRFDIFSSLIFHEGLELRTINLNEDILEAEVIDKYEKECLVLLGSNKEKIEVKVKTLKDNYAKIYTNLNIPQTEQILAETFKGK
ncbi:MAG: site-specific DNA-methyltransferase [Epsilonproteobacteria bacterium]|nr:site-specific DNA-methyltransferase [Campylobacterota bacterium]